MKEAFMANSDEVRCKVIDGEFHWLARDVGRLMGFDDKAKGGNFSRLIKKNFEEGKHYFNGATERNKQALWLRTSRMGEVCIWTARKHRKKAPLVAKFWEIFPVYASVEDALLRMRPPLVERSTPVRRTSPEPSKPKMHHLPPCVTPSKSGKAPRYEYVGQRGKIKGMKFLIYSDADMFLRIKRMSFSSLKDTPLSSLPALERAVHELLLNNRREMRKRGIHRVNDHLAFAASRGVAKRKYY
jgi:hypothetical protein